MNNLLRLLKSFYSWESTKFSDRIVEVFTKTWITILFLLFIYGWTILVINFILDPTMFNDVQYGIFDTLGT